MSTSIITEAINFGKIPDHAHPREFPELPLAIFDLTVDYNMPFESLLRMGNYEIIESDIYPYFIIWNTESITKEIIIELHNFGIASIRSQVS